MCQLDMAMTLVFTGQVMLVAEWLSCS